MSKAILETVDLNKTYDLSNNQVLKNINIKINDGEFVSIMGPSGSGKSTLLYCISGMDYVSSGKVMFNNQNLTELTEKELSNIRLSEMGFVFQQPHLLKNLSIIDNIILSAYLSKGASRNEINMRAHKLMTDTGIKELANKNITQASGGQLQRVGICRALINNPRIIFGDEPTGALNSKATNDILDLLITINNFGSTILLVTHDIKVAAKSERVLFMVDGEIVGEKRFNKFKIGEDAKEREQQLAPWLIDLGF